MSMSPSIRPPHPDLPLIGIREGDRLVAEMGPFEIPASDCCVNFLRSGGTADFRHPDLVIAGCEEDLQPVLAWLNHVAGNESEIWILSRASEAVAAQWSLKTGAMVLNPGALAGGAFQAMLRRWVARHRAGVAMRRDLQILGEKLVRGYGELVQKIQDLKRPVPGSVSGASTPGAGRDDLDCPALLRGVLRQLRIGLGRCNAVVFLPAGTAGQFKVGAFVHESTGRESARALLEHLADVAAPLIAEQSGPRRLADAQALEGWLGADAAWFDGCEVLATPCLAGREVLAGLLVFRDASEPFVPGAEALLKAVARSLAKGLARLIDVHHRHQI